MGEYASMEPQLAQWPHTSATMDSCWRDREALSGRVGVMDFGREIYCHVMLQMTVTVSKCQNWACSYVRVCAYMFSNYTCMLKSYHSVFSYYGHFMFLAQMDAYLRYRLQAYVCIVAAIITCLSQQSVNWLLITYLWLPIKLPTVVISTLITVVQTVCKMLATLIKSVKLYLAVSSS